MTVICGGVSCDGLDKHAHCNAPVAGFRLTVHPWYGYAEESILAQVSTIKALRQVVGDQIKRSDFKLYYSPLKDGGPILDQKTDLSSDSQFADVERIGSSKVFYTIGGSPKTSPKKEKPKSPFIKLGGVGVSFGELPIFFLDKAVQDVAAAISSTAVDRRTVLLFATPGSGKSRTVQEAARLSNCQHLRVKLSDGLPFIAELKTVAGTLRSQFHQTVTYHNCKVLFNAACQNFIASQVKHAQTLRQQSNGAVQGAEILLHFDECQLLMGSEIVTQESFRVERVFGCDSIHPYLWHLVMPTFCDVLDAAVSAHPWLRAALSGTNFFAPLVLHTGSHLKVEAIEQFGVFPVRWVLMEVLDQFFVFEDSAVRQQLQHDLSFLCSNRRAVSYFCSALLQRLELKTHGSVVTVDEIREDAEAAYDKWARPINNALGGAPCVAAIQALAFLTHLDCSKQLKWVTSDKSLSVDVISLPVTPDLQGIVQYGQAGGLNLLCSGIDVTMMVPTGCVLRYLTTKCSAALLSDRHQSLAAFCRVARESQPDTQKGHVFERVFAAELVMYGTQLYPNLSQKLLQLGAFKPDPLVFASCWVDHPTIFHQRNEWLAHTVYCVREDAKDKGRRWVDVGFPVIDEHGSIWKVMCEMKTVASQNKLWKMCFEFFDQVSRELGSDEKVAVLFVSSTKFQQHVPRERASAKNAAYAARLAVVKMLGADRRLFIVDGHEIFQGLKLPVMDMVAGCSDAKSFAGVSSICEEIGNLAMYSSPGAGGGAGDPRQRGREHK